jgi:hypothetical protein
MSSSWTSETVVSEAVVVPAVAVGFAVAVAFTVEPSVPTTESVVSGATASDADPSVVIRESGPAVGSCV